MTIAESMAAFDFELQDLNDQTVRLSDFKGQKNVLLVFNRGFF